MYTKKQHTNILNKTNIKPINYRYKVLNESSPIECSRTAIVSEYTAFRIEDTHTFLGIFEVLKSNFQYLYVYILYTYPVLCLFSHLFNT